MSNPIAERHLAEELISAPKYFFRKLVLQIFEKYRKGLLKRHFLILSLDKSFIYRVYINIFTYKDSFILLTGECVAPFHLHSR